MRTVRRNTKDKRLIRLRLEYTGFNTIFLKYKSITQGMKYMWNGRNHRTCYIRLS